MCLPEHVTIVSDLAYSPDGAYLASADDNRRVTVFTTNDYKVGHILSAYIRLCVDYYVATSSGFQWMSIVLRQ